MRSFSVLSSMNFLIALLSYLRFAWVAKIFGADWKTDAFAVSLVVPFLIRDLITYTFASSFLPIYARVFEEQGRKGAVRFVNRVLTLITITGVVLLTAMFMGSRSVVLAVSPGVSPDMLTLAAAMLKILAPMVLLKVLSGILTNFTYFEKRYMCGGIANLLDLAVSAVIILAAGPRYGIMILPISFTAGVAVSFVFMLASAMKSGYIIDPNLEKDRYMPQLFRMAVPVLVGAAAAVMGPVVDKMLASFLRASSITALDYGDRIRTIVNNVAFTPFAIMAEVSFSAFAARGEVAKMLAQLNSWMNKTSMLIFPIAAALTAASFPFVSILFQRGSFSVENARYVSYALACYAPWLLFTGLFTLTSRVFYALKDTTTPVTIGIIGLVLNILLNFILIEPWGIGGLALATSFALGVKAFYQAWALSRKLPGMELSSILPEQLKMLLATGVMTVVMLIAQRVHTFAPYGSFPQRMGMLLFYVATGGAAYLLMLAVLRCRTMMELIYQLKAKILDFRGGNRGRTLP
ncbi:MAG: lipid II flippase MurJ [Candidatus Fermentibacteraceae bacterium]